MMFIYVRKEDILSLSRSEIQYARASRIAIRAQILETRSAALPLNQDDTRYGRTKECRVVCFAV